MFSAVENTYGTIKISPCCHKAHCITCPLFWGTVEKLHILKLHLLHSCSIAFLVPLVGCTLLTSAAFTLKSRAHIMMSAHQFKYFSEHFEHRKEYKVLTILRNSWHVSISWWKQSGMRWSIWKVIVYSKESLVYWSYEGPVGEKHVFFKLIPLIAPPCQLGGDICITKFSCHIMRRKPSAQRLSKERSCVFFCGSSCSWQLFTHYFSLEWLNWSWNWYVSSRGNKDKDRVQMSGFFFWGGWGGGVIVVHGNWWAVAWSKTYWAKQQLPFLQATRRGTNRIRRVNVS